eukprot:353229-Chlamydomonas_euryale.AAC.4
MATYGAVLPSGGQGGGAHGALSRCGERSAVGRSGVRRGGGGDGGGLVAGSDGMARSAANVRRGVQKRDYGVDHKEASSVYHCWPAQDAVREAVQGEGLQAQPKIRVRDEERGPGGGRREKHRLTPANFERHMMCFACQEEPAMPLCVQDPGAAHTLHAVHPTL